VIAWRLVAVSEAPSWGVRVDGQAVAGVVSMFLMALTETVNRLFTQTENAVILRERAPTRSVGRRLSCLQPRRGSRFGDPARTTVDTLT
jgi:hypothetical protein